MKTRYPSLLVIVLAMFVMSCDFYGDGGRDDNHEPTTELHWVDESAGGGFTAVFDPVWISNDTIVAATGGNNFATIDYPGFTTKQWYWFDFSGGNIDMLGMTAANPNGNEVASTVFWEETLNSTTIETYDLTQPPPPPIFPATPDTFEESPSYRDEFDIVYMDYWVNVASTPPPNYEIYSTIYPTSTAMMYGAFGLGYMGYDWYDLWEIRRRHREPAAAPGDSWILILRFDYATERETFAILTPDGASEVSNGLAAINADWIKGGDWIDDRSFVLPYRKGNYWALAKISVNSAGEVENKTVKNYLLDNWRIQDAFAADVSPDGTKAVLNVWAEREEGGQGAALVVVPLD